MLFRKLAALTAFLGGADCLLAAELPPVASSSIVSSIRRDPALVASPEAEAVLASDIEAARPTFWAEADYLLWFERRQSVPLLVGSLPDSEASTLGASTMAANPLYPTNGKIDF